MLNTVVLRRFLVFSYNFSINEAHPSNMASNPAFPTIKHVRTFLIDGVGSGGDYHNVRKMGFSMRHGAIAETNCR